MILTMLFVGVAMVASLADYHLLFSIHRPLGIAILILVIIRYLNRKLNPPPEFMATMPPEERIVAHSSEMLMYAMMFCDAADRMGNAVGGTLSDRALRPNPSASYPAAQSDALRGPAQDAYYRRILVLRDIHCAFRCGPIPHPDLARRPDRQDRALEGPWTRNRKLGLNSRLLIRVPTIQSPS